MYLSDVKPEPQTPPPHTHTHVHTVAIKFIDSVSHSRYIKHLLIKVNTIVKTEKRPRLKIEVQILLFF